MQSDAKTVAAYVKEIPADRAAFSALRKMIKRAAPDAKERMASGMPCYVLGDCPAFALASQKNNLALYVCGWKAMDKFRSRLGKVNCGKGCIRFKKLTDLPLPVVEELLAAATEEARQCVAAVDYAR